ncbi:hypothetical protein RBH29_08490 [Herbivorax sp. ANBcel31]|uniref:hypothetical protein n=1 Tax=Herbivorax sp. ANBcel31 TaxID=3069754 RepID=UPI0027B6A0ED|nr:hypothetical protein [Herbivorax sp. ANBcel31]MDQ2086465.1 hypothetical protein [Herbivorax sp. ANBcel31]
MKKFIFSVSLILFITSVFATAFVLSQNNYNNNDKQPMESTTDSVTVNSDSDTTNKDTQKDVSSKSLIDDKLSESENNQESTSVASDDSSISDSEKSSEIKDIDIQKDIIKENLNEDKNIITAPAEYVGQIDNNSIEVIINKTHQSLRIEKVHNQFHNLNLDMGDTIIAKYYTNEHGQNIILEISNLTEDKNTITAPAEYVGQIDNNSIEVIINKTHQSLRIEKVHDQFHNLNLDMGDTIIAKYYTNEHGQNIILEISK